MLLLIDGYNLLHQSDLLGRGRGDRWLQQARQRLVQKLVQSLDPAVAAETCIVFDAAAPPPDLPHSYLVAGIRLLYAVGYCEADDLLEELIAQHPAPRRLAVVSSDHRVQRAARRRRASAFDADAWYARLIDHGPQLAVPWPPPAERGQHPAATDADKPLAPVDEDAVRQWMRAFQLPPRSAAPPSAQDAAAAREPPPTQPPTTKQPKRAQPPACQPPKTSGKPPPRNASSASSAGTAKPPARQRPTTTPAPPPQARSADASRRAEQTEDAGRRPRRQLDPNAGNPFPEGYGDDLLE